MYSPKREVENPIALADFGLTDDRRTIVAYTSSPDEVLAAQYLMRGIGKELFNEGNLFADQIEWLEWLIVQVERSDDLQLVVRVHPREGRVKSRFESDHLHMLQDRLAGRTDRSTRIVWPEESVSSYGLADIADAVTISWSSIGLELGRLAVPIVSPFPGRTRIPAGTFLEYPSDRTAYWSALRHAIGRPANWDEVAQAFRWYSYSALSATIDLSAVIESSEETNIPTAFPEGLCDDFERYLINGHSTREDNKARRLRELTPESVEIERHALRQQYRRIALFLLTGRDDWRETFERLSYDRTARESIPGVSNAGRECTLVGADGSEYVKNSVLLGRMLDLIGDWEL